MKKFILFILMLFVLTFAGLVYYSDVLIKTALEQVVPMATKTPFSVDVVDFSFKNRKVTIKGVDVGNPEGFSDKSAFYLGEVSISFDESVLSTTQNKDEMKLNIDQILIDKIVATYELNNKGSNIDQIMKNVESFTGPATSNESETVKEPATDGEAVVTLVSINDITFSNSELNAVVYDKEFSAPLPTVNIKNIGGEKGVTVKEASMQVLGKFTEVMLASLKVSAVDNIKTQVNSLSETIKEKSTDLKSKFNSFLGGK